MTIKQNSEEIKNMLNFVLVRNAVNGFFAADSGRYLTLEYLHAMVRLYQI
jgi:hypothetical protein